MLPLATALWKAVPTGGLATEKHMYRDNEATFICICLVMSRKVLKQAQAR